MKALEEFLRQSGKARFESHFWVSGAADIARASSSFRNSTASMPAVDNKKGNPMKPNLSRRQFVLGSASVLAAAAFRKTTFAQSNKLGTVPTVDSLTVKVLIDSSYDSPRAGTS